MLQPYQGRQVARPGYRRYVPAGIAAAGLAAARGVFGTFKRGRGQSNSQPRKQRAGKRYKTKSTATVMQSRSGVTYRKRKRVSRASKKRSLKKRVRALERMSKNIAVHDYRYTDSIQVTHNNNECAYGIINGCTAQSIEESIDNLTFIDRAATPALDSIDLRTLGRHHDVNVADIFCSVVLRNNAVIPCIVDIYTLIAKDDTGYTPLTAMTQDDANYNVTDSNVNIQTYPSDFALFNRKYKIVKHARSQLNGGDEMKMVYSRKLRKYDPEVNDEINTYNAGDQFFFIRTMGVVAHDATTTTSVGRGDGGVDVVFQRKWKIKYPSDAKFKTIEPVNQLDTMAVNAEVSGPNVVDQKDEL